MHSEPYPRDLIGYGPEPPHAGWPGDARVCVSLVIAVEEGSEYSILHGDAHSESILSEVAGLTPIPGEREVEHRVHVRVREPGRLLAHRADTPKERGLTATVYAVAMALERNPAAGEAAVEAGFEVMSHGYRWINYHGIDEATEREHIEQGGGGHRPGLRPASGRAGAPGRPSLNTRRLVVEAGGFLYDSDSLSDDLPYWETVNGVGHLVIPHQFDNNDTKFVHTNGFAYGGHYEQYLKDTFDVLYREGLERPKMMTVSLHSRIVGRPGRIRALERFLDYVLAITTGCGSRPAKRSPATGWRPTPTGRRRRRDPARHRRHGLRAEPRGAPVAGATRRHGKPIVVDRAGFDASAEVFFAPVRERMRLVQADVVDTLVLDRSRWTRRKSPNSSTAQRSPPSPATRR